MRRASFGVVVVLLLAVGWDRPGPKAQARQPLVGAWLLTSEQLNADTDQPTPAQGARGLLVFDGAGHSFERPCPPASTARIAVCTARITRRLNTPVSQPCENSCREHTIPDRVATRVVAHLTTG